MKRFLTLLLVCLTCGGLFVNQAKGGTAPRMHESPMDTVTTDSMVNVIAYFAKGDTCDYQIVESKWKIAGTDSTMSSCITTKVRLVVTDSTASGYRMTYTFMDVENDTTAQSRENALLSRLTEKLRQNVVGTTIEFETDEYGDNIKICNLAQIKKKAKALFKEGMKELQDVPELKALKTMGLDINDIAKEVDTDDLVEGYVEELKMLFICHGGSYPIGETEEHEDATDDSFESTTYKTVSMDDDGGYDIDIVVSSIMPKSDFMALINGLAAGLIKDKGQASEITKGVDDMMDEDGTITDRVYVRCFDDGWPNQVVKQRKVKAGKLEKINQTYIGAYHFSQRKP